MIIRRDVFQAIADPTRREIIQLVVKGPQNLNAIAGNFDVSRQAISLHIKILEECGLLVIKKQGRERYCEAQIQQLNAISRWVEQCQKLWNKRLDRMEALLDELQAPVKTKRPKKKIQRRKS